VIVRGNASVSASRSFVGTIHNYANLTYTGNATTLNLRGDRNTVRFSSGDLRSLNVESGNNTVTIGAGADITFCTVDGSGNDISGSGKIGSVSFSGSSNKLDVSGANVVSNTGANNVTNTLTGTYNMTGAEIISATTINVTFDAKIQTAPASAFTLSGNLVHWTSGSATPNSTSISSDGRTVTLTFTSASFTNVYNYYSGTVTCTDAVVSSEKATLNTKSVSVGWYGHGQWYYDPVINWPSTITNGTISSITNTGTSRNLTITLFNGSSTSIEFWSGAYSVTMPTAKTGVSVAYDTNWNYWNNNWNNWGGYFGHGYYHGAYRWNSAWYEVYYDSSIPSSTGTGYYYYRGNTSTRTHITNLNDSNWDRSGFGGFGGYGIPGTLTIGTSATGTNGSTSFKIVSTGDIYYTGYSTIEYTITLEVIAKPSS